MLLKGISQERPVAMAQQERTSTADPIPGTCPDPDVSAARRPSRSKLMLNPNPTARHDGP